MKRMNMHLVEIDWTNAPLAKFVNERTRKATARVEALPAPAPVKLEDRTAPRAILISVDADWPAADLVRRLSANGLRLQMDGAHLWKLLAR